MSFKPFMGVSDSSGDGPIFVDTISSSNDGKMVDNLGNSDMKNFSTNDSAMDLVNSPSVAKEFGLGSGPVSTSPAMNIPVARAAPVRSRKMGAIDMKSGEFWGVVGLAFASGVLGKYLFDQYVK
tara:strand:- start:166 stop:537 length:372 start_codon:yes stop_codon:yes gene_type:complete